MKVALDTSIRARLSVMMFFEYFIWGAWYVTLGTWLASSLHFSGKEIGLVAGTTAIGACLAPFFVGLIADKWFATERLTAALHIAGAALLFIASIQTSFWPLYALLILYSLCYMPTLALTNSLSFRHISDPSAQFGGIRVFGTLGWIVAGLLVGTLRLEPTAVPLRLAAACSLLMGFYCFTLPHTPPLARSGDVAVSGLFPREAIMILKRPSVAVFAIASLLICIPLQFYYAFTNLFLNQTGVTNAAGKMTGGQISELLCMLLIPWFFRRLGVKGMLLSGMAAWALRYVLFAFGDAGSKVWMLWAGIIVHGICYDFFFVAGQIYIDREAPLRLRAAAQGLISFITYGVGMFVGAYLSGVVVDHFAIATQAASIYNWHAIWLVCACASAAVFVFFLLAFRDNAPGEVEGPLTTQGLPAVPQS